MIKYPLYQSSSEGMTPFYEYKVAAQGDKILEAIESQIKDCYDEYERAVGSASVHTLNPHGFADGEKDRLKKLYKSDCNVVKKIRQHHNLYTKETKRVYNNRCPYCTLSESDTIEHILPQGKYPEFAIHLYNLIPCCSKCNRYKNTAVRDGEDLPYAMNFYYHDPEAFQFLEVDCKIDSNGRPAFNYRLAFPIDADPILVAVITNHFDRLHLIERYNAAVVSTYTQTELAINPTRGESLEGVLQRLRGFLANVSSGYGLNHYFIALLRCLVSSSIYHEYLQTKIT